MAVQMLHFNVFCLQRLHLKFYEEKCIALLKKYPEAVNSPKLPLMYTPFLVRAKVMNLYLSEVKFTGKWSTVSKSNWYLYLSYTVILLNPSG